MDKLRTVFLVEDGLRSLVFYELRHLRRVEYLDEQFGKLLGYTKTTTGIYDMLPQSILSQRIEMVEAITYPRSVDLNKSPERPPNPRRGFPIFVLLRASSHAG